MGGGEGFQRDEATRLLCLSLTSQLAKSGVFVKGIVGEAAGKTSVGFHGNTNRGSQAIQVFGSIVSIRQEPEL